MLTYKILMLKYKIPMLTYNITMLTYKIPMLTYNRTNGVIIKNAIILNLILD